MAQFSWASGVDVGLGLLSAWSAGSSARAVANANNEMRDARNRTAQSEAMLRRTMQQINNRRILDSASKNLDTMTRAFSHQQDSFAAQGFEASIQQAEAAGRIGAAAAAAGMTGSSVQAVASVASVTAARANEYRRTQQSQVTYEQLQTMAGIVPQAIRSLDNSAIVADYDSSRDTAAPMSSYLMAGLLSKKNSLHTLLGSLAPDPNNPIQGIDRGTSYPVTQGNVQGTDLERFAFTRPVWDYQVTGTPLPSVRYN